MDLPAPKQAASPELSSFAALFAEELGLVLEVHPDKAALVSSLFNQAGVPCSIIGSVLPEQKVDIKVAGEAALSGNTAALRWACVCVWGCVCARTGKCGGVHGMVLQGNCVLTWGPLGIVTLLLVLTVCCADIASVVSCRDVWEETSFALERLQAAEECVDQEQSGLKSRTAPTWKLPYTPAFTPADKMSSTDKVRLGRSRLLDLSTAVYP